MWSSVRAVYLSAVIAMIEIVKVGYTHSHREKAKREERGRARER